LSRLIARLVLAVALLAAWQSALVHPLKHSDGRGGFVHLADGHDHGKQSNTSGLCDALAALTACAPGSLQFFDPPVPSNAVLVVRHGAPRIAEALPFLSQGPPAVL
jgi:hypothetical protein